MPTSRSTASEGARWRAERVDAVVELLPPHAARDTRSWPTRTREPGSDRWRSAPRSSGTTADRCRRRRGRARAGIVARALSRKAANIGLVRRGVGQHEHVARVGVGQRQREDVHVGARVLRLDDQQLVVADPPGERLEPRNDPLRTRCGRRPACAARAYCTARIAEEHDADGPADGAREQQPSAHAGERRARRRAAARRAGSSA